MHPRELLTHTIEYVPPARALEGLSSDEAERLVAGAPHSIAQIIAHAAFWQAWFHQRCSGVGAPLAASASVGWPEVARGSWPELHQRFLGGLDALVALGEDAAGLDAPLAPPIEFPPLAHYTVRDALTHVGQHNAHHIGQVILLRQLMGCWPPPSGSYTW